MLREQNRQLARQALWEVLRSRLFWLMVGGGVLLDLAREGTWVLYAVGAGFLFLVMVVAFFRNPGLLSAPWLFGPEWAIYDEVQKLREEVRRLRRGR